MMFVMTATPLAVVGCGLPVAGAAAVIQWHLVCMFAAFYSFMKKAKLWEMQHGRRQPDFEAEHDARVTIPISAGSDSATGNPSAGQHEARQRSA